MSFCMWCRLKRSGFVVERGKLDVLARVQGVNSFKLYTELGFQLGRDEERNDTGCHQHPIDGSDMGLVHA
jgi:hypothetical protein